MKKTSVRWAAVTIFSAAVAGATLAASPGGGGGGGHRPPPQGGQGQHPQGGGGGGSGGSGGQGDHRGPTSRPSPDQLFDQADTNKDGVLSRAEFKAFLESHRPPRPPAPKDGD